jgi:hypothetical protein
MGGGRLFPAGEGKPGPHYNPAAPTRAPSFCPACSFPDPRGKRLIIPCFGRLKFPVPRPRQPATGGL